MSCGTSCAPSCNFAIKGAGGLAAASGQPLRVWHSLVNILVFRKLQGSFSLSEKIRLQNPIKPPDTRHVPSMALQGSGVTACHRFPG